MLNQIYSCICGLLNDTFNSSDHVASNAIRVNNVSESHRGLIWNAILAFASRDWMPVEYLLKICVHKKYTSDNGHSSMI